MLLREGYKAGHRFVWDKWGGTEPYKASSQFITTKLSRPSSFKELLPGVRVDVMVTS